MKFLRFQRANRQSIYDAFTLCGVKRLMRTFASGKSKLWHCKDKHFIPNKRRKFRKFVMPSQSSLFFVKNVTSWCTFSSKSLAVWKNNRSLHHIEPTKPLNDAQMCGSFFYMTTMTTRIPFPKGYKDSHDLVQLLLSRGLSISNHTKAEHYLKLLRLLSSVGV